MVAEDVLLGSVVLFVCTLVLCELLRWISRRVAPSSLALELALEVVSTLQLCCCTIEMALLGTKGNIELWLSLTLTYLLTALHCLTFRRATCNPCGSLDQWLRGQVQGTRVTLRVLAQFAGAALSWVLVHGLWSLGLSPLHGLGRDCQSFLHMTPGSGAFVEMTCSLSMFLVLHLLPPVRGILRPHVVATTITVIVYAAGPLTGAFFNPALAVAVVFLCHGNTYQEYILVYWIGPLAGTAVSFFILKRIIPKFRSTLRPPREVKED